jgi:hypothetical protein
LSVDLAKSKVHVVQPDGRLLVFLSTSATVITLDGAPVGLAALQAGFRVRVNANENTESAMVAARIDALSRLSARRHSPAAETFHE